MQQRTSKAAAPAGQDSSAAGEMNCTPWWSLQRAGIFQLVLRRNMEGCGLKLLGSHITVELQGPAEVGMRRLKQGQWNGDAQGNPAGILVSAADETTLNSAATGKHWVPEYLYWFWDSDAADSGRLSYVGTDNYDFGANAAKSHV